MSGKNCDSVADACAVAVVDAGAVSSSLIRFKKFKKSIVEDCPRCPLKIINIILNYKEESDVASLKETYGEIWVEMDVSALNSYLINNNDKFFIIDDIKFYHLNKDFSAKIKKASNVLYFVLDGREYIAKIKKNKIQIKKIKYFIYRKIKAYERTVRSVGDYLAISLFNRVIPEHHIKFNYYNKPSKGFIYDKIKKNKREMYVIDHINGKAEISGNNADNLARISNAENIAKGKKRRRELNAEYSGIMEKINKGEEYDAKRKKEIEVLMGWDF